MNNNIIKTLNALKNASLVQKPFFFVSINKEIFFLLSKLYSVGLILGFTHKKKFFVVFLRYFLNLNVCKKIKLVSTSTKHLNLKYKELCQFREKNQILIFFSSSCFNTSFECKYKKLGGKLIFVC